MGIAILVVGFIVGPIVGYASAKPRDRGPLGALLGVGLVAFSWAVAAVLSGAALYLVFGLVVDPVVGYGIGRSRGRGPVGALLGLVLGGVGWIIAAFLSPQEEFSAGKRDYEVLRLVGRRLVQLAVVLIVVSFFTFLLIRLLPGDPVQTIIPFGQGPAFARERAQLRADLGLNKGFFAQYWDYLKGLAQLHFGHQYSSGRPVSELVKQSLPVSLELMIYAMIISLVVAIPLGVLGAYRAGTRTDSAINTTAFGLLALPNFVLALVLSFFIGAKLKLLPTGGYAPGWLDPLFSSSQHMQLGQHLKYMLLPSITLAAGQIAIFQRLLRSDMIQTLQENFITLAKAKGLSNRRILWRHALRPSSLTLLTVAGLSAGTLIGGAVVVEVIFSVPGMGEKIFQAINAREYVELQSYIVIIAVGFVLVNFFVDFLYAVLDPRIRRARVAA